MKRRAAHIIILVALLLTALAGAAVAQDEELTLEGVSTFIGELRSEAESLTEQVIGLVARVEAIEGKLTHSAYLDYGGDCRLAIRERMHTVSMVNYLRDIPTATRPTGSISKTFMRWRTRSLQSPFASMNAKRQAGDRVLRRMRFCRSLRMVGSRLQWRENWGSGGVRKGRGRGTGRAKGASSFRVDKLDSRAGQAGAYFPWCR